MCHLGPFVFSLIFGLTYAAHLFRIKQALFTYNKPAQEGRNHMTQGELLDAIQQSETFFRPLTCWAGGIVSL